MFEQINFLKFSDTIVYCATRKTKFILRMWSLMPKQSEGNNDTSKLWAMALGNKIHSMTC